MGTTLTTNEKLRLQLAGAIVPNLDVLPPEVVKYFLGHKDRIQEALKSGFVLPGLVTPEPTPLPAPTEKFALLVDLGIITVPDDYVHENQLTKFCEQNRNKFYYYNDKITDKNFPNPSRVLKPGDKLRVRVFKQVVGGTTASEEHMAFLATQKAIHTGAQGLSLVFEQKRDQLPKGKAYASFDEKDHLWAYTDSHHVVPNVDCDSNGDFRFYLGDFGSIWGGNFTFLCFNEVVE